MEPLPSTGLAGFLGTMDSSVFRIGPMSGYVFPYTVATNGRIPPDLPRCTAFFGDVLSPLPRWPLKLREVSLSV